MCGKGETMMLFKDHIDSIQRENQWLTKQAATLTELQKGQNRWHKNASSTLSKVTKEGRIPYGKRTFEKEKFQRMMQREQGIDWTY